MKKFFGSLNFSTKTLLSNIVNFRSNFNSDNSERLTKLSEALLIKLNSTDLSEKDKVVSVYLAFSMVDSDSVENVYFKVEDFNNANTLVGVLMADSITNANLSKKEVSTLLSIMTTTLEKQVNEALGVTIDTLLTTVAGKDDKW